MYRTLSILVLVGAALLGAVCFVGPVVAIVREVAFHADWSRACLSARQWGLVGHGVVIAVAAAALTQIIGAGLAVGLVQRGRLAAVCAWVCLTVLLVPPYVYAYAWSLRVLPEGIAIAPALERGWLSFFITYGRAVWVLACWMSPIAAAVLVVGWRSSGRPAVELALVDARPRRALWRLAPGVFGPWLALSLTATGMLALTEYSVCHLCLVNVWNTEILTQTQEFERSGQALLLGWPMLAIAGLVVVAWLPFRARFAQLLAELATLRSEVEPARRTRGGRVFAFGVAIVASVAVMLPIAFMAASLHRVSAFGRAWYSYPRAWPDGLLVALGCIVVSGWLAIGIDFALATPRDAMPRSLRGVMRVAAVIVLGIAAVFAVAPPALVGDAFLAAYLPWPLIADGVAILWFTTAARFALIAVIAMRIAGVVYAGELPQVAAVERVGWSAAYWRIRLPLALPALAYALIIVGLLALTEVSATFLVTPPAVQNLARTLLNEIHNGRQDDVIAMALYLVAFVGIIVALTRWGVARYRRRAEAQRQ